MAVQKSVTVYAPASNKYPYQITTAFAETINDDLKANNQSIITITGSIYGKNISYSGSNSTMSIYWFDDNEHKNGTLLKSEVIANVSLNNAVPVSGNITVNHKPDGTLKGYSMAVFTKVGSNSYVPPTTSVQTDETALTTIPRATKIGNYLATIGQQLNITWTRASDTFTHTLSVTLNGKTEQIGTNLIDGTEWTPVEEWYEKLNLAEAKGVLSLTTYSGDKQIGDTQTSELTLRVNEENSRPVIVSKQAIDTNDATIELTGDNEVLVLQKSNTELSISFQTRKNATATNLLVNNVAYELPEGTKIETTTQYNVTLDLGTSMSNNFTIVVTDSRGLTNVEEVYIVEAINYLLPYCKPSFKRAAPTTGEVAVTFNGGWFNGDFGATNNTLKISYVYKKKNDEDYSTPVELVQGTDYVIQDNRFFSGDSGKEEVIILSSYFDYRFVYDGILYVEDKLTRLPINFIIIKGIPIFWWNDEKVVINGELHLANSDGEEEYNLADKFITPKNEYIESTTDVYSSDYINNQEVVLFDGVLMGGNTLNIDMTPYKRLLITFVAYNGTDINTGGCNNTMMMDLTTTNDRMAMYVAGMSVPYVADDVGGYSGDMWCQCKVSADKQSFVAFIGWQNAATNGSDMYSVRKIIGVK